MARQGISEEQVFEAAGQLAESGEAVTVSAVREIIGSGSYSTITAHLVKWKASEANRPPADVPAVPEPVGRAMRQLWAAAWKEGQNAIKTEREGLDAARREMERERRDMAQEIARLETEAGAQLAEVSRLTGQLAEASTARGVAEKTIGELKIENARLDERTKSAEARAEELRQELARLHARFQEVARQGKESTTQDPAAPNQTDTTP